MERQKNTEIRALLDKEQTGTLTSEEQALLDAWYNGFDESQKDLKVFRDDAHEAVVKERLLNRIMQSMPAEKKPIFRRLYTRIAVAASLLALISFAGWKFTQPAATIHDNTQTASIGSLTLPDGSTVMLNKHSKISYSFGNKREVFLTGEAFFDVKKDERPFEVHTGKITTHVLGTSFNIKTTPNSDVVEITVVQGKVSVTEQRKSLAVLLPDQQLNYNEPAHQVQKSNANAKLAVLWKETDLKFENVQMEEVVPTLESRYGVQIKLASADIKDSRFTAYFLNTSNLTQVLNVITQLNNLSWTKEGDSIYIINKMPD
jgi:transmembrane sensor